jgi:hypothetical protein
MPCGGVWFDGSDTAIFMCCYQIYPTVQIQESEDEDHEKNIRDLLL